MNQYRPTRGRDAYEAGPQINMTADGRLLPPTRQNIPGSIKIGAIGVLVAGCAGALVIGAVALWLAMLVLPVVLVGGAVAYAAFRYQMWRGRGAGPIVSYSAQRWSNRWDRP